VIITSDPCLLELRNHTTVPVAFAEESGSARDRSLSSEQTDRWSGTDAGLNGRGRLKLGGSTLRFHEAHAVDAETLERHKHLIPNSANLQEPLERVREALAETVRTVFAR